MTSADGGAVDLRAESICCHGDTPGAVEIAAAVRQGLEERGVTVAAPPAP
ncbi:MAG TPA: LamB/YcsF family protein [Candidatus Limnocylindria bacterium]